ncbi:hypothetical protein PCC7424_1878 [Gloeothece citriformis PCC 7424]|uniref:Uncharacterized protein n=1 Tax=Gloeothece citriformis (strain PCC 7424) TaxID=65393 RepID=B7KDK8_GLOC7|nr:hypothetical protein [Gloeothece citriformis]ACK70310.1 hypothetical protein PCC7424_1878 [Gloeothece citriformis PCC 7424]
MEKIKQPNPINQNKEIKELEAEISYLESEVYRLHDLIRTQEELINELQCRADPYLQDGTPICNSQKY